MKIAVIGGGTAGFMAAAHISKFFPEVKLTHIFDPNAPTIGVGEGTTPGFPEWLSYVTAADFASLVDHCDITRKSGIKFNGWGQRSEESFDHLFYPIDRFAYHISATKLVGFLGRSIKSEKLLQKAIKIFSMPDKVRIYFENSYERDFDFVVLGAGFPQDEDFQMSNTLNRVDHIPTNTALVMRTTKDEFSELTTSTARKHGWIFKIPLTNDSGIGYIYNQDTSDDSEVTKDFECLMHMPLGGMLRKIRFPNFYTTELLKDRVMKIGNSASFFEPLEATAIGVVLAQLHLLSLLLVEAVEISIKDFPSFMLERSDLINLHFSDLTRDISTFISAHYLRGSKFNSKFWDHAISCSTNMLETRSHSNSWEKFEMLSNEYKNKSSRELAADTGNSFRFGGFPPTSLFQVMNGIGYYPI